LGTILSTNSNSEHEHPGWRVAETWWMFSIIGGDPSGNPALPQLRLDQHWQQYLDCVQIAEQPKALMMMRHIEFGFTRYLDG
jgi:hypothetical protein